jgi:hypothetical protein
MSMVLDNGGRRRLPHSGLDYSHWAGAPIYVIGPGTVVARGTNPRTGWGYHVWVDHGDLGDGRHAYSYYAHMQALGPAVGTRFRGGETIGHIGATGSGITGAHLHWGVALARRADLYKVTVMNAASRDYLIDPARFVAARLAGTASDGITPFPEKPIVKDIDMRILYNEDAPESADATRRAIVGELSFQVITGPQSTRERKFWGDPVNVTVGEWDAARDLVIARRTELGLPVSISSGGSVPDLTDLPTKGELTQALTSTVSLVNEHADANKDEIIAAIPSGGSGGSASAYNLSLDIEQVPGTATGTATPQ